MEKEIIPYRIEPNYIDINDYNLTIKDNSITFVENKQNRVFVTFDSLLIGDGKATTGLVSTSLIKVYTTLYSKDILNILHIHLNDTSQEITIDSEFLEKDENVLNHKVFLMDATGKRLTYKLIFKDSSVTYSKEKCSKRIIKKTNVCAHLFKNHAIIHNRKPQYIYSFCYTP